MLWQCARSMLWQYKLFELTLGALIQNLTKLAVSFLFLPLSLPRFMQYFWIVASLALSPQAYMLGLLGIGIGLTWPWCLVASFLSALLAAVLASLTCHAPSKYGVPLTVAARASFGVFGSKIFSLLHLAIALPWAAWLLCISSEGLRVGITRFRPSLADWAPLRSSLLPAGYPSLLSLLCLVATALLLLVLHIFGKVHALRSLASTVSTTLLSLYLGLAIWATRLVGFQSALVAYNTKLLPATLPPSSPLSLYIALPLVVLAGLGCWSTPLLLGYGDVARWCSLRSAPRRALLLVFPLLTPLTTFLGCLLMGAIAKGWTTEATTPTALLRFLSPPLMALIVGICFCLAFLHTTLQGYLLSASHALTDVLGPRLLRNSTIAGSFLVLASFLLALIAPSTLLDSSDARSGTGSLSLSSWSLTSGLVAGAMSGVLLSDYFWMRATTLPVDNLYKTVPRLHACGVNAGALVAVLLAFVVFGLRSVLRAVVPLTRGGRGVEEKGEEGVTTVLELLNAVCFFTTFPVSFLAYALTYRCFTASLPYPPPSFTSSSSCSPPVFLSSVERGVGISEGRTANRAERQYATAAAATAAATAAGATSSCNHRETYPPRTRPPPLSAPRPSPSQQSASSRATEQLTATLHQLLLHSPPPASAPPATLHEPPPTPGILPSSAPLSLPRQGGPESGEGREKGDIERFRDVPTSLGPGNGRDEETKMEKEGGDILYAYAVTVHDVDDARK